MNKASEHQPAPQPGQQVVGDVVLADIRARMEVGHERYGTYLQTHNGRSALWDLYQELLDACMYIRQHIAEQPQVAMDIKHQWREDAACFDCPCGETDIQLSEGGDTHKCSCGRLYRLQHFVEVEHNAPIHNPAN